MAMAMPLVADCLADVADAAHGFFTRRGGVSAGGYASLNCGLGSKDDPAAVQENRTRVTACLGAALLITAHQVHSASAVIADAPWRREERPRADAIVTGTPGLAVAVLTADCAPVLFADPVARIVAAAHAGWRGALGGVLEATLSTLEELGGRRERVRAAVGPCIGQAAYEVGFEFEAEFLGKDAANGRFFSRPAPAARPHFDLAGYCQQRLLQAGVGTVRTLATCTHERADEF